MLTGARIIPMVLVPVLLSPIGAGAVQQESGWYIGGAAGRADHDIEDDEAEAAAVFVADVISLVDPDVVFSSYSLDSKDTGWRFIIGYEVDRNLAIEGFWVNLGESRLKVSGVDTFFPAPVNADLDVEADGYGIAAVGKIPVGSAGAVFGKIGIFQWETELAFTYNHSLLGTGSASLGGDDGSDPVFGMGYQHAMGQISLRIEWERYDVADTDIDLISAGGLLHF